MWFEVNLCHLRLNDLLNTNDQFFVFVFLQFMNPKEQVVKDDFFITFPVLYSAQTSMTTLWIIKCRTLLWMAELLQSRITWAQIRATNRFLWMDVLSDLGMLRRERGDNVRRFYTEMMWVVFICSRALRWFRYQHYISNSHKHPRLWKKSWLWLALSQFPHFLWFLFYKSVHTTSLYLKHVI